MAETSGRKCDRPRGWDTPEHWLEREEEARAMADQFHDPALRDVMTRIAEGYRRLAEHAATAARTGNA